MCPKLGRGDKAIQSTTIDLPRLWQMIRAREIIHDEPEANLPCFCSSPSRLDELNNRDHALHFSFYGNKKSDEGCENG